MRVNRSFSRLLAHSHAYLEAAVDGDGVLHVLAGHFHHAVVLGLGLHAPPHPLLLERHLLVPLGPHHHRPRRHLMIGVMRREMRREMSEKYNKTSGKNKSERQE